MASIHSQQVLNKKTGGVIAQKHTAKMLDGSTQSFNTFDDAKKHIQEMERKRRKEQQQQRQRQKERKKKQKQMQKRVFANPTVANQISLCMYQLRVACTTSTNPIVYTFGFIIFMCVFSVVGAFLWTILILLFVGTILVGLYQFVQFLLSKCTSKCSTRPFGHTCFYSGLKVCGNFLLQVMCIGWQPRTRN